MIVIIRERNTLQVDPLQYRIIEINGGRGATGPASGDLSGTYPAPTVARIRGRLVDPSMTPEDGEALTWDSYLGMWMARSPSVALGQRFLIAEESASLANAIVKPQIAAYDPDTPPDIPSAYDDEFMDAAIGEQWEVAASNDGVLDLVNSAVVNTNVHINENELPGWLLMQNVDMGELTLPFTPDIGTDWTVAIKAGIGLDPHTASYDFSGLGIRFRGQDDTHMFRLFIGTVRASLFVYHTVYNVGSGETDSGAVDYGSYAPMHPLYVIVSFWTSGGYQHFSVWISGDGIARTLIKSMQLPSPGLSAFSQIDIYNVSPDASRIPAVSALKFIRFFEGAHQIAIGKTL